MDESDPWPYIIDPDGAVDMYDGVALPLRDVRERHDPEVDRTGTHRHAGKVQELRVLVPRRLHFEGDGEPHTYAVEVLSCGHYLTVNPYKDRARRRRCYDCFVLRGLVGDVVEEARERGVTVETRIDPDGTIAAWWTWPGARRRALYGLAYGHAHAPTDWKPWTASRYARRLRDAITETRPEPRPDDEENEHGHAAE